MEETKRWAEGNVSFGSTLRDEAALDVWLRRYTDGLKGMPPTEHDIERERRRLGLNLPQESKTPGPNRQQRRASLKGKGARE